MPLPGRSGADVRGADALAESLTRHIVTDVEAFMDHRPERPRDAQGRDSTDLRLEAAEYALWGFTDAAASRLAEAAALDHMEGR